MSTITFSEKQFKVKYPTVQLSNRFVQGIKFMIVLGLTIALMFYSTWAGLAFLAAACILLSKEFFSFVIYILKLDYDLSKDIFKDLEPL